MSSNEAKEKKTTITACYLLVSQQNHTLLSCEPESSHSARSGRGRGQIDCFFVVFIMPCILSCTCLSAGEDERKEGWSGREKEDNEITEPVFFFSTFLKTRRNSNDLKPNCFSTTF